MIFGTQIFSVAVAPWRKIGADLTQIFLPYNESTKGRNKIFELWTQDTKDFSGFHEQVELVIWFIFLSHIAKLRKI